MKPELPEILENPEIEPELVETYPDTLIDRVGVSEIDPTGEEVDVASFFSRDLLLEPEKKLMFAVLELGVQDFMRFAFSTDSEEKRKFHRTVLWLRSDDTQWPYAYVCLCHALGVDEIMLRDRLFQWRRMNALERI